MLARHMPELLPTYRRLVELTGGDEVAARMLTMWNMPAFLPSCSQAVLTAPSPVLCRNYDYSPDLWEATIYSSAFTGRKVIGTGDCLWGLLDGMNDAGLVVSLTFGGRPGSGPGFAIPLVVRYLLEVAETAGQAEELLRGLPIAMSYNLTVVDAAGESFTAFVAPDSRAGVLRRADRDQPPRSAPGVPRACDVPAERARGWTGWPKSLRSNPPRTNWRRPSRRSRSTTGSTPRRSAPCTPRSTGRKSKWSSTSGPTEPGGAASTTRTAREP